MYESQLDGDWQYILCDCGARIVLRRGRRHRQAGQRLQRPASVISQHVIDFDAPGDDGFAAFMRAGEKRDVAAITPDADDVALFIYTSGTTGKPKGVLPLARQHRRQRLRLPGDRPHRRLAPLAGLLAVGARLRRLRRAPRHDLASAPRSPSASKRERILEYHRRGQADGALRRAADLEPHLRRRAGQRRREAQAHPVDLRRRAALALASRSAASRAPSARSLALPLARALIFGKVKQRFGGAPRSSPARARPRSRPTSPSSSTTSASTSTKATA